MTGVNFVREAMRRMLGRAPARRRTGARPGLRGGQGADVLVLAPASGADPMLGVEMASTGEVGCFGDDMHEALLHGLLATGFRVPRRGRAALARADLTEKYWFADEARVLSRELGLQALRHGRHGRSVERSGGPLHHPGQGARRGSSGMDVIDEGLVDLVVSDAA